MTVDSKQNKNKILDYTITLYSNRLKIVKEVVCKPTEVERVIDELDKQASIPRRGDGHHGYYIEVEVRRYKDVYGIAGKRPAKSDSRKVNSVHAGGQRSKDDRKPGGGGGRIEAGVRRGVDGVSRTEDHPKARTPKKRGQVDGNKARQTSGKRRAKGKVS